ncbi:extensin-like domain-containing protein [Bosea vaviloviae]|uniref:extensin-like domain-containing protein n=1 Tax=Bosea vaviloviae TaxID=1526658 RepID=UPI0018D1E930|nr:extensin family protein [Bosea vaviloviae]
MRHRRRWRYACLIAAGSCALQLGASGIAESRDPSGRSRPSVRQRVVAPLPPRRPADLPGPVAVPASPATPAPEADQPTGPSTCLATFADRGGIALPSAAESGSGACAIEDPVTFRSVAMADGSKVELDSAVTLRCSFALEVVGWLHDDLPAIMSGANGTLSRLVGVGGHACRPRNGVAGAPISEHASGNALDVSALRLKDGRTVSLIDSDKETRALRESLQKSACARFATVLGPGSDSSHKDHLHLDMRKRPRDFKLCQWAVE